MSEHVIKVPDIGEGIAEVELVAWHVQAGDTVEEDQILADVMTDKATVEIPSPVAGTVVSLAGAIGQPMPVGGELIRIATGAAGALKQDVKPAAAGKRELAGRTQLDETPAVRKAAAPAQVQRLRAAPRPAGEKPLASPSVRRQARERDIDLAQVAGSGPGGRILHEDLEVFTAPATARSGRTTERQGEERIPVIGLRRKIAQTMQASKRNIPHFSYVEEIDVTELEALRAALNERWAGERPKLTLLPFLARAIVNAVVAFPQVNARYDDEAAALTRYAAVHLGVATQTEAGLMVPVLRHAEALDPWACATEIIRLAQAARSGKATLDELRGSTITLTSLGALGGIASTPVINPPEVAIVGVNRIVERPVYQRGHLVPRLLMNLSSSFDHRVVDGMVAAEFIQHLRGQLEAPAMLFIE